MASNGHDAYDASEDEEMAAFLSAGHLASAYAVPMTLKAVIELGVLDIMADAGPGRELSPAEIASKIPNVTNPHAAEPLDRMLRYLASSSVLTCSAAECDDGDRVERRYGLTPVCKFLVSSAEGTSLAPLILMNQVKVRQESWQELKYAVTEGVIPFEKAHGVTEFGYMKKDPEFNKIFNDGMSCTNTLILKRILSSYSGFHGIKTLVDVGGGVGTVLNRIVSKFPHIKGINFDLPYVIADAPSIPGVEHISGDMFESIPNGDAIFMKWVLHDWNDELSLKILSNCLKALPDGGKVMIVEFIIPEVPDEDALTQVFLYGDLCMLNYTTGGKERTENEFKLLANKAGFSEFKVVRCAFDIPVIEMIK